MMIAAASIIILELFADPISRVFISTRAGNAEETLMTVGYSVLFLRIRCLASPVQFLNYNPSYCMQAMGNGRGTLIHAIVRQLVFYVPFMLILDRIWSIRGLACALPLGELCGALFALWLLERFLRKKNTQI